MSQNSHPVSIHSGFTHTEIQCFARRISSICLSAAIIERENYIIARLISENSRGRVSNPFSVWIVMRRGVSIAAGILVPRTSGWYHRCTDWFARSVGVHRHAWMRRHMHRFTSLQLPSAAGAHTQRVPRHASLQQRINSTPADKSTIAVLSKTRRSAYGPSRNRTPVVQSSRVSSVSAEWKNSNERRLEFQRWSMTS